MRQRKLGDVVQIQRLNQSFVRSGNDFLRLDHFQTIRDSGAEPVFGFDELLVGQVVAVDT